MKDLTITAIIKVYQYDELNEACRQVILETEKRYGQPIRILLYGKECIYEVKSIGDLLPLSFDASAMEE